MYINVAYLNNSISVVKDLTRPLSITSCGHYNIDNGPTFKTNRPKGRGDYQLLYVADGKAHFRFNGEDTIVSKGEMVLFRPYEPQVYNYYPKDKCDVYWVHFTGFDAEKILSDYGLPIKNNLIFSGTSPDYVWLFEQMIRELQLCRFNYEELLALLLQHVFLLIKRHVKENNKAGVDALNEIERSIRYFNENYNKQINIEKYAQSLHISPCWFIRRFKAVVKQTPMQYILSIRLANAKLLLETTSYNITEISNAVGYDNPLYFSRLFSKHVGISPSEYKTLHS